MFSSHSKDKKKTKTTFYHKFDEDVVQLKHQDYQLPLNYNYDTKRWSYRLLAPLVSLLAWILGWFYAKFFLHLSFKNKKILKPYRKTGYFVYGNHTLPEGDGFTIFLLVPLTKVAAIVAPENLAIPILGKLLPYGGVVPIPSSRKQILVFNQAVNNKIAQKKAMFIYPEAHVWPYYRKIRPLSLSSFHYPVETQSPVFCKTTTFQKRKFGKKPKITVYLDGPITWNQHRSRMAQERELRDKVQKQMERRSQLSTYEYIKYQKIID